MTKEDLNEMIVDLFAFYIHLQDENEDRVFDHIVQLCDDERIVKRLSSAFAFIAYFYPLISSRDYDGSGLSGSRKQLYDLYLKAEDRVLSEDEENLLCDLSSIDLDDDVDPSLIN